MKRNFIPYDDTGKDQWLSNFAAKLPTYAAKYGIATAEVTDTANGYAYFHYWLDYKNKYQEYTKKLTEFKNQLRDGVAAGALAPVVPTVPIVATVPTAVMPDIIGRASSIAARIKANHIYSSADGNDLGIEGHENTLDLLNIKPNISVRLNAHQPEIVWNKHGMGGLEIYVSRDGGSTFMLLAFDTIPNFIDTHPLPAAGQSEVWKYKAQYKYKDALVGQMSDETTITVSGRI